MDIAVPHELLDRAARWPDLKRWERKELGQELRRLGLSYGEIGKVIPVSKGSLIPWCRDIKLTPEQEARLRAKRPAQAVRLAVGARRRQANLERVGAIRAAAKTEGCELLSDPFWVAGVMAYWAEGSKRTHELHFSNSDPDLIALFINWGIRFLGVSRDRFTIALHLHRGQEETERQAYWSRVTAFGMHQFRKTFFKPEGTGHRKNVLYNGTASIRVTCSTDLLHRVMGWIDAIGELHAFD